MGQKNRILVGMCDNKVFEKNRDDDGPFLCVWGGCDYEGVQLGAPVTAPLIRGGLPHMGVPSNKP
jgi:hypothetical protein